MDSATHEGRDIMSQLAENLWSQEAATTAHASNRAYNLVSLVGYLVGVRREMFDRDTLIASVFDELHQKPQARIVRSLCILRNALMKRYDDISYKLQYELLNLDRMPDIIDSEVIQYLNGQGVKVVKANCKASAYIPEINRLIADHIQACQSLFPLWVKWQYIRSMFLMPGSGKDASIAEARRTFSTNINSYPFHCYINWPNLNNGNILHHDSKFVTLLYEANGDHFDDLGKVRDIGQNARNALAQFIGSHNRIAIVVDCENSDPYKLCAALRNIQHALPTELGRIQKIILYDDVHTVDAWNILSDYVNIPIEHELIERVNNYKSLVDIRMTAGTCKEHYKNGIDGFLLVSSDSDFWGLISSLPTADFLVLVEYDKCGDSLRGALDQAGIFYCFMDDFADNASDIKVAALRNAMQPYLDSCLRLNVNGMMDELYSKARIEMTPGEKKSFFDKYVRSLKLILESDGSARILVCK
jgi:uncharacterized LabA/DUF88 family protein